MLWAKTWGFGRGGGIGILGLINVFTLVMSTLISSWLVFMVQMLSNERETNVFIMMYGCNRLFLQSLILQIIRC